MSNQWANGVRASAICDVCGFQFRLGQLRKLVVNTIETETKACPKCWTPDQPQLQLGRYPVEDPQAIRDPRPDSTYYGSGLNALGNPGEGSRITSWGWAPIGGGIANQMTPNPLVVYAYVGDVTITTD